MENRELNYIKGRYRHRRTERGYISVLLDAVTLNDWRDIVGAPSCAVRQGRSL